MLFAFKCYLLVSRITSDQQYLFIRIFGVPLKHLSQGHLWHWMDSPLLQYMVWIHATRNRVINLHEEDQKWCQDVWMNLPLEWTTLTRWQNFVMLIVRHNIFLVKVRRLKAIVDWKLSKKDDVVKFPRDLIVNIHIVDWKK